jgi:hypothetical protein
MRSAALRPLLVVALTGVAALGTAAPAGAHGGTTIAEGGSGGVRILVQGSETQTAAGNEAIDLATTLEGPGTGDGATVVYYVRPAGGEVFRARDTERDEAGIAHVDVPTEGRGDWRRWDVSAVVRLNTGKRLRVSNAESNPPGPEPASTAGGGATGAEGSETTTGEAPATTTATTDPTASTPSATTEAPAGGGTATAGDEGAIEDVSGEDEGTPGWVVPSAIVLVAAALGLVLVQRRRRGPLGPDDEA